jgi:hypothetical protein
LKEPAIHVNGCKILYPKDIIQMNM